MIQSANRLLEALSKRPFPALVNHFVKRLFASEEEQGGGGFGFGIGAILAVLASPGAFASILLMGKYSTLLQWMRGEHIDAIHRSPSDEYFFVTLSMTITGFVMVTRWNRLFPDRRDFSNLAVLPIPIRSIFLANFAALLGLALVFAIDVNAVSALLFPLFVTMSYGTFAAFWHVGVSHLLTVLSASLFSFFAVFGLVGVLMLLVPRRLFRIVSVATRMLLVIALLLEFFSKIFVQLSAGQVPGLSGNSMGWLPAYWFLGIYERMLGIAKPQMVLLGRQAVFATAAAVVIATVAYVLSYRTVFVRLPETFDMLGSCQPFFRVQIPDQWLSWLFRSPFERASSVFTWKVLLRSEPHLMFLGSYLGAGAVLLAQTALELTNSSLPWQHPTPEYLSLPLLMAFLLISGLRFAFDMPASLEANWIFRLAATSPEPEPRQVARRLLLLFTFPLEILLLTPLTARNFGWSIAWMHSAIVAAATLLFVEFLFASFQKVPFTCKTPVDVKRMIVKILLTLFSVLLIVPALAELECWALLQPLRLLAVIVGLVFCWCLLLRCRREIEDDRSVLTFEDGPAASFELLDLRSGN